MSSTTAAHTPALSRDAGRVLEILRKRFGAARVEELAKATDLSKAEVLEVLCDLESDGLVEPGIYRVTADGRAVALLAGEC